MGGDVLVLRSYDHFSTLLEESGINVVNLELISTQPHKDQQPLLDLLKNSGQYDAVFITSPVAAQVFVESVNAVGRPFGGTIYVLGGRSKRVFDDAGIDVEFDESANTARGLATSLKNGLAGKKLCFVRGDRSMRSIPDVLRGTAAVDEVEVYSTFEIEPGPVMVSDIACRIESGDIRWACFFSPSAVETFEKVFGSAIVTTFKTAVIGLTTARRAAELGFDVAFLSPTASAEAFAREFAKEVNAA